MQETLVCVIRDRKVGRLEGWKKLSANAEISVAGFRPLLPLSRTAARYSSASISLLNEIQSKDPENTRSQSFDSALSERLHFDAGV